jgi:protein BCP1
MNKDLPPQSDDEISSEEEGEDLILEGVLVKNIDAESSSSDEDSDDDAHENGPQKKKAKTKHANDKKSSKKQKAEKKKQSKNEPEILDVEFTFNDMKEAYFHGMKNFLLQQPAYAPHASEFSDIMIENVAVGTVVSTDDGENNVFGFASVLNITSYGDNKCVEFLKKKCLESCPVQHKREMETVVSGKTKRPAGMIVHGRMVNLPLEITHILHEQLVQDMDWAVDNFQGGEEARKSLNFGAFILLAPCTRDTATHSTIYKNFDDEIFAGCAEFTFPMKMSGLRKKSEESKQNDDNYQIDVIVLTKDGHRRAMEDLKSLIQS